MVIIAQLITVIQEIIKKVLHEIPVVFVDSKSCIYILVKELQEDIENFILTGKTDKHELHLLSKEQVKKFRKRCRYLGLKYSFHRQTLEYMRCKVAIVYPQVKNPKTGVMAVLIPWFMLPSRPFPIFAYAYGIWHYSTVERTSMRISAVATRDLFGTGSFDASTLSRSITAMENIIDVSAIDRPLSTNEPRVPSTIELISSIPELLIACPTIESLEKAFEIKAVPLPPPVNKKVTIPNVLSNIPKDLYVAVSGVCLIRKGRHVTRKRYVQPQKKEDPYRKHKADFVETLDMKCIRLEFIAFCKAMILDEAIGFHRTLILNKKVKKPPSCATAT
jgi:hypothetical protein